MVIRVTQSSKYGLFKIVRALLTFDNNLCLIEFSGVCTDWGFPSFSPAHTKLDRTQKYAWQITGNVIKCKVIAIKYTLTVSHRNFYACRFKRYQYIKQACQFANEGHNLAFQNQDFHHKIKILSFVCHKEIQMKILQNIWSISILLELPSPKTSEAPLYPQGTKTENQSAREKYLWVNEILLNDRFSRMNFRRIY